MNNVSLFFKLGYKFINRYFLEYFLTLLKPLLAFALSMVFVLLCKVNPFFVIPAIVSIPLSCWAMWRMYVIFYAIIPACYVFLKNGAAGDFESILKTINQKELATFAGFVCIIFLLCILPFIFILIGPFINIFNTISHLGIQTSSSVFNVSAFLNRVFIPDLIFGTSFFILIILSLMPFLCFGLQAFCFKKSHENYLFVYTNCYKYFNSQAVIVLILLGLLQIVSGLIPIVSSFIWIILTPYSYAVCTFWYYSRIQKKN